MKAYDCLASTGRDFEFTKPYPGLHECRVSGQHFYAIKPNTGGERNLAKFDAGEAAKWAQSAPNGAPVVLDIECLRDPDLREIRTDVRRFTGPQVEADAAFLSGAVRATRTGAPGRLVGVYGLLPGGFDVYNRVLLTDRPALNRWRASNDYLAHCGLLSEIVAFYPSLYAASNDGVAWKKFAQTTIAECHRLSMLSYQDTGRRVRAIPFLCPTFHPSAGELANKPVGMSLWKLMLNTLKTELAVGAVLWHSGGDWKEIEPYAKAAAEVSK